MLLKPGVALSLTSNGAGRRTLNQPTKFDLVIDFMIAKARLDCSAISLLGRADGVIE
jgi:hypothetical protein